MLLSSQTNRKETGVFTSADFLLSENNNKIKNLNNINNMNNINININNRNNDLDSASGFIMGSVFIGTPSTTPTPNWLDAREFSEHCFGFQSSKCDKEVCKN